MRSLLTLTVVVVALCLSEAGRLREMDAPNQPVTPMEILGRLAACSVGGGTVSIAVETAHGTVHVRTAETEVRPWPSVAQSALVKSVYRVAGPCPPPGEQIRVTQCPDCARAPIVSVELGGASAAFNDRASTLWLVREFFDRAAPRTTGYQGESFASLVLARYNRRDRGRRCVWLRGRLDYALDAYNTDERVRVMVARFGTPDLLQALVPLRAIYDQHRNDTALVKGLPFIPADARASPFIGAWGVFALEVFVEQPGGALTRLFGPSH